MNKGTIISHYTKFNSYKWSYSEITQKHMINARINDNYINKTHYIEILIL
jgi:hypothetical protein